MAKQSHETTYQNKREIPTELLLSVLRCLENSPSEKLLEVIETALGTEVTRNVPHQRQAEFLALQCEEAMFGGAVGGGKTEALIKWLEEGVKYPGYSGLFLRRTYPQLQGSPTTPIERSQKFFRQLGGEFSTAKKRWTFPNGAIIRFGHMQHEDDKHNYDGPEFHRIAFDQVEQFTESQYTYMFSRLRRTVGFELPCGVRSAANPVGGSWVKRRFVSPEAIDTLKKFTAYDRSPPGMIFDSPCGAKFVPSRIADNPSLEVDEYIERLRGKLGATLAARLANGDWSVVEGAIIDPEFIRYYTVRGAVLSVLSKDGEQMSMFIDARRCQRFATIDTAGTSKQKAQEEKGKPPSFSVVAIWDYWSAQRMLFLRHIWRERVDWTNLKRKTKAVLSDWDVRRVAIEKAHVGPALAEELEQEFNCELLESSVSSMKSARIGNIEGAKHERAVGTGFLTKLEDGEILIPEVQTVPGTSKWMPEFESELLTWAGTPDETADQIDVCSYACQVVGKPERFEFSIPIDTRLSARRRLP